MLPSTEPARGLRAWPARRLALAALGLAIGLVIAAATSMLVAVLVARSQLPDITRLSDYRPKLPLRIYSADGVLLGEYGEERRSFTPIDRIPPLMQQAVLAAEDARFYEHGGVDLRGVLRAVRANVDDLGSQGASTITMQVARNFYLTNEKTPLRKFYETLLTFEIEKRLTKPQILELYMNQIYLGQRAYGFAAASEIYFGKPLEQLDVAEAAMLAGIPKGPNLYNPIANPRRAASRQHYVLGRMLAQRYITPEQHAAALAQPLAYRHAPGPAVHAEYAAEAARQMVHAQYGDATYTRGLNVHLTIGSEGQEAAYRALRKGILDFERRQPYRGPEARIVLPADPDQWDEAVARELAGRPDNDEFVAAVVTRVAPAQVEVMRRDGEVVAIEAEGLKAAAAGLRRGAKDPVAITPGAVVRVMQDGKGRWSVTQLPEVEGALVALDPASGDVQAMVGGFDYGKSQFNHVTQAWRQPGSTIKPLIYSAALEQGLMPTTVIDDAPLVFEPGVLGPDRWEPRNADGQFEGPMPMHTALAKSKNLVSIRILQSIGAGPAHDWLGRFGLDVDRQPATLSLALGSGSATPLQMASAYGVFANGGHRLNPRLIHRITDAQGHELYQAEPPVLDDDRWRSISPRNAFVMDTLLRQVTAPGGTAGRAQGVLKRRDIYGKTGTTNDAVDAWFAGFQPSLAAVVWMGYDNPRPLGDRESGGGLALPVWLDYMQAALKGVPVAELVPPPGVVERDGQWVYGEHAAPVDDPALVAGPAGPGSAPPPAEPAEPPELAEQRQGILDLFK